MSLLQLFQLPFSIVLYWEALFDSVPQRFDSVLSVASARPELPSCPCIIQFQWFALHRAVLLCGRNSSHMSAFARYHRASSGLPLSQSTQNNVKGGYT